MKVYNKKAKEVYYKTGTFTIDHSMTFADLCEYYFKKRRTVRKSTSLQNDMYSLKKFESLNDMPIFMIKPDDIKEILDEMERAGNKPSYINKIHATISKVFLFAIDEELVYVNPMKNVPKYERPDELLPEMQYWTYDEFSTFIQAVDKVQDLEHYLLFNFLYFMGCRKGEAIALKWEDINFVTGVVRIYKTITQQLRGCNFKLTPPKTKNSVRSIKMPSQLSEMLKERYDQVRLDPLFSPNDFVFGGKRPIGLKNVGIKFRDYAIAAGVKTIRIHDLRHSHASLLINNGANIKAISSRLGDNVDTVLSVYTHLFQETEDELVRIIEKVTGAGE